MLQASSLHMTKTITDLKCPKRHPDRTEVYLNHDYAFTLRMLDAASLNRGQQLNQNQINRFCILSDQLKAQDKALGFLRYRPRSRYEMMRHLKKNGFSAEIIQTIIERLRNMGLVDDRNFARQWVQNRCRFKPKGKAALQWELKQKGITQIDIDAVLVDIDEAALANKATESRLHHWEHLPRQELKKKVVWFLRRRGFSHEKSLLAFKHACSILNR